MNGQYLKEDIPDFSGIIADDCRGRVEFADRRPFDIHYLKEEYKIILDRSGKGETWNKGKRFTFFVLFQLRICNI